MDYSCKPAPVHPRIIIHGGAGNITRDNLPPKAEAQYRDALLSILDAANARLLENRATALDIASYAVSLLEENPLFNAGHGAVYTTAGTHELEASVMVSRGYRKRGVGVMKVTKAKSPIKLAREMLIRGEEADGGGAQGHCQLHGDTVDRLAEQWGLEMVKPSYFWTRRRWDEHRRGLGLCHDDETYEKMKRDADEKADSASLTAIPQSSEGKEQIGEFAVGDIHWDGQEYLPQGTVGAVVLDSTGVLCVATSTGGLTNKLPGRIGDTPTLGAGFWSEEWDDAKSGWPEVYATPLSQFSSLIADCLPNVTGYKRLSYSEQSGLRQRASSMRGAAMSGTGNGDSFLRVNAVRTAAAIARYSQSSVSLQQAVTAVAGPHGQLQRSAGDRWDKTGEGEGGIIGIELRHGQGRISYDYNCGGMFHAWIDDDGKRRFEVFQDGSRPPPY